MRLVASLASLLPAVGPPAFVPGLAAPHAAPVRACPAPPRPALGFEANAGQAPTEALYQARAAGYLARFSPHGVALLLGRGASPGDPAHRVSLRFAGGRADAYVARIDASGRLASMRILRGSGEDTAAAIALGPDGTVFVAGETDSPDFPAAANAPAGGRDAFVAVLAADGTIRPAH